ncbi:hypothetical protein ESCO_004936 [Escovopsis weberi]|uniref:Rhodopsin domain-containing protein n=1 Tax=Escovopsis weberi TaxID=150374 RepID=A0A0M8MXZ6_ESCWE|nr:hypothetical protein ESCO_004936 [Escovopsis weberi]
MRAGARWYKIRRVPLEAEDLLMYGALAAFAIESGLCLATLPTLFKTLAVGAGLMAPWPTLMQDASVMLKEYFAVSIFFWLTLWMVKWSLLCTFKKLTNGLPGYTRIWWGILVFSIVVFLGSCISNFTACHSMHAWFTVGECDGPADNRAKLISLWFSLASDLTTDLLIMAVPLRVVWDIKISRVERISLGFVFAVGLITMITGIIRSVTLSTTSATSATPGQVSTQWLVMWAGIEGLIAIIVGCLPSFAVFIRGRQKASQAQRRTDEESGMGKGSRLGSNMGSNMGSNFGSKPRSKPRKTVDDSFDDDAQQIWAPPDAAGENDTAAGNIVVTQTWKHESHPKPPVHEFQGLPEPDIEYELDIVGAYDGRSRKA